MSLSSITAENIARHLDPRSVDLYSRDHGLWPIEEALLREFVPAPPASILDLGCGAGRTTQALRANGWKAVALDCRNRSFTPRAGGSLAFRCCRRTPRR